MKVWLPVCFSSILTFKHCCLYMLVLSWLLSCHMPWVTFFSASHNLGCCSVEIAHNLLAWQSYSTYSRICQSQDRKQVAAQEQRDGTYVWHIA